MKSRRLNDSKSFVMAVRGFRCAGRYLAAWFLSFKWLMDGFISL